MFPDRFALEPALQLASTSWAAYLRKSAEGEVGGFDCLESLLCKTRRNDYIVRHSLLRLRNDAGRQRRCHPQAIK